MLNWPLATAVLVVQLTAWAAPWALVVVPVGGAVTVMALKAAAVTFTVPGAMP